MTQEVAHRSMVRRMFSKGMQIYKIACSRTKRSIGHVLMIHQVGMNDEEFCITPEEFETLVVFLSKNHTIRLENWEEEKDFFALTIDDVPEGFYVYAFPILKKYKIPFTLFVSISLLDTEGYITTGQLLEMANSDFCTVGSHGVRHVEYYTLNGQEIAKDLKESKLKLSELIGKPVELFAFPYGSYYACGFKHKKIVIDTYKYGFGTVKSTITSPSALPHYFLPRINVDSSYIKQICG